VLFTRVQATSAAIITYSQPSAKIDALIVLILKNFLKHKESGVEEPSVRLGHITQGFHASFQPLQCVRNFSNLSTAHALC
jgi:hypothetical protein